MIRLLFRLLSLVALAVSVIMAVVDATRTVAASALVTTPLGASWEATSPATLAATRRFLEQHLGAAAWEPLLTAVLSVPGFAVFLVLAFVFAVLGHRPQRRRDRLAVEI